MKILMQAATLFALNINVAQGIEIFDREILSPVTEKQKPLLQKVGGNFQRLTTMTAFIVIANATFPRIFDSVATGTFNARQTGTNPSTFIHQRAIECSGIQHRFGALRQALATGTDHSSTSMLRSSLKLFSALAAKRDSASHPLFSLLYSKADTLRRFQNLEVQMIGIRRLRQKCIGSGPHRQISGFFEVYLCKDHYRGSAVRFLKKGAKFESCLKGQEQFHDDKFRLVTSDQSARLAAVGRFMHGPARLPQILPNRASDVWRIHQHHGLNEIVPLRKNSLDRGT